MIHKKIFSILALLSLAVSGAWAQDTDITVSPTENTNEWTFQMPEADVEVNVEYCDDASATVTAATGVTAGSGTALVNASNVIGGQVKYAIGDNDTTAPTSGWSETVPTAANFTEASTANVWYYVVGDNTHSDTEPACVQVTIAASEAPATTDIVVTAYQANGAYWATFYTTEGNYKAPEETTVYTITLNGTKLTMNKIDDGIVKSGNGVVLKNTTTGSLTMTKTEETATGNFEGNSLNGTMERKNKEDLGTGTIYVLFYQESAGVGFYKLADDGYLDANKAYLQTAASSREYFLFDETTAISAPLVNSEEVNSEVYDLQGRRVNTPTKGMYIVNGRKVVVK